MPRNARKSLDPDALVAELTALPDGALDGYGTPRRHVARLEGRWGLYDGRDFFECGGRDEATAAYVLALTCDEA